MRFILLLFFIVVLGVTVVAIKNAQDIRQRAASSDETLFPYGFFEDAGVWNNSLPIRQNTASELVTAGFDSVMFTNGTPDLSAVHAYPHFHIIGYPVEIVKQWIHPQAFGNSIPPLTIDAARKIVGPIIDSLKNDPNIIGYNLHDDARSIYDEQYKLALQVIKEHDATRSASPMLILQNGTGIPIYTYTNPNSIMGYYYPFGATTPPCSTYRDSSTYQDYAETIRNIAQYRVNQNIPMYLVLQGHGSANPQPGDLRYPSPEEMRLMHWMALGEETRGIFWFTYHTVPGQFWIGIKDRPDALAEVSHLSQRLQTMKSILTSLHKTDNRFYTTAAPDAAYVSTLVNNQTNELYVIAANSTCSPQSLTLKSDYLSSDLKDVETGTIYHPGDPMQFSPGDGRLLQVLNPSILETGYREPNLLQNGSMEQAVNGKPAVWAQRANISQDTTVAHSGTSSMKIIPPTDVYTYTYQSPVLKPNTNYRFSIWTKTDQGTITTDGIGANAIQTAPATQYLGKTARSSLPGWVRTSQYFKTPSSYSSGTFQISWSGLTAGTVFVDDVVLCEDTGRACEGEIIDPLNLPTTTPTPQVTNKSMPQWDVSMYSQDVEEWWANHPFNPQSSNYIPVGGITSPANVVNVKNQFGGDIEAAFNSLPATGGTLFLDPGIYTLDTITYLIGKSNVHIISNGDATIKGGGYFYIASCDAAKNYSHFNALVIVGDRRDAPVQDAIRCATVSRIKNIYFKNIIFDGAGIGKIAVAALTTNGMVFDKVSFQNYISASATSGNFISAVAMSDNIWVRGSQFTGNGYNAAYFDGCHGCGFVENTFSSNFTGGLFDGKTNSDFTNDWDENGTAEPNSMDMREMNHFIFSHNTFGQTGNGITPLNELVIASMTNSLIEGNSVKTKVKGLVTFNGKCISPIAPQLATFGSLHFSYTNLKVIGNTTQNLTNLVRIDASTPNCNGTTNSMTIGKYVVENNIIQNAPNFKGVVLEANGTPVGPNIICGNTVNNTLTDPACSDSTGTPVPTSPPATLTPALPTHTPTPQPTTIIPTNTPFPTPTPVAGRNIALTILLHGIGNGGDSVNPNAQGNFAPLEPQRMVTLELYLTPQGLPSGTSSGVITFNQSAGNFTGNIPLPSVPDASYLVRLKTPGYLNALTQGILTLDQTNTNITLNLSPSTLVAGDSNNDDSLNIFDYNILADCYSDAAAPKACNDIQKKHSADLNDDGNVNGLDINLFLRNIRSRFGE